jgi:folylpolyglutamate synthase
VRERIRLNGAILDRESFAGYLNEVYERLQTALAETKSDLPMPAYFRFLTLLAFHIFLMERVDVAIIEVGIGGQYDSTNILEAPSVTGITSLGYDHQPILGSTLAEIAWHKSGIFKQDIPAVTVSQDFEAMEVIQRRAKEINVENNSVEVVTDVDLMVPDVVLGLSGEYQKSNAALAVRLSQVWYERHMKAPLSHDVIRKGLRNVKWPGRAQLIETGNHKIYLDGAHTPESILACTQWFQSQTHIDGCTLVFNCTSGRDSQSLLAPLIALHKRQPFTQVHFTRNMTRSQPSDLLNHTVTTESDMAALNRLQAVWPGPSRVFTDVDGALEAVESKSVFVTGSLHLVGAVLSYYNYPVN